MKATDYQTMLNGDDRDAQLLAAYQGQSGYSYCDKRGRELTGQALLDKLRDMAYGQSLWGTREYRLWMHDGCGTECSWCYPRNESGDFCPVKADSAALVVARHDQPRVPAVLGAEMAAGGSMSPSLQVPSG